MSEFHQIRKMSNIDVNELQRMADRLKLNNPEMFHVLTNPNKIDPELYERTTVGLVHYLRKNEVGVGQEDMPLGYGKVSWDLALFLDPKWRLDHTTLHWRSPKSIKGKIIDRIRRLILP